ncbi:MAG: cyanophycinase [Thermoanaerobaculia bacterium]|nr:cyanophycinase [Thermoanaerobaculia bacterium]
MRAVGLLLLALAIPLRADLVTYSSGNDGDVNPRLHGPLLILEGGGGDVSEAMQTAIDMIRGCTSCDAKLDVVVLRASGSDGYNGYLMAMNGVDSVVSMVITDRESASRADVVTAVRNAEVVFFAGGDQCNYVKWIKGTATADAVKRVYRRGGGVGGTSAGLAIQGEVVYDACNGNSAKSVDLLANPMHDDVSLSRGFFSWPALRGVITDTHFQQRDRMGRLLVFLSRSGERLGLGVSEGTVLLLRADGRGTVHGAGPAHVIERTGPTFVIRRFEKGATIDLRQLPATGKRIEIVNGLLSADPY